MLGVYAFWMNMASRCLNIRGAENDRRATRLSYLPVSIFERRLLAADGSKGSQLWPPSTTRIQHGQPAVPSPPTAWRTRMGVLRASEEDADAEGAMANRRIGTHSGHFALAPPAVPNRPAPNTLSLTVDDPRRLLAAPRRQTATSIMKA